MPRRARLAGFGSPPWFGRAFWRAFATRPSAVTLAVHRSCFVPSPADDLRQPTMDHRCADRKLDARSCGIGESPHQRTTGSSRLFAFLSFDTRERFRNSTFWRGSWLRSTWTRWHSSRLLLRALLCLDAFEHLSWNSTYRRLDRDSICERLQSNACPYPGEAPPKALDAQRAHCLLSLIRPMPMRQDVRFAKPPIFSTCEG